MDGCADHPEGGLAELPPFGFFQRFVGSVFCVRPAGVPPEEVEVFEWRLAEATGQPGGGYALLFDPAGGCGREWTQRVYRLEAPVGRSVELFFVPVSDGGSVRMEAVVNPAPSTP